MLDETTRDRLAQEALQNREKAYVPYSGFAVGAALLAENGRIYGGANIENAAFGPTNCAERTALFSAVFAGERHFAAIAVAGGKAGNPISDFCAPCGVCRQVMREFCGPDFEIFLVGPHSVRRYTLSELLPESFGPDDLR